MASEVLILSDVGLQAVNNASAGGLLVDATTFKIGNSAQSPRKADAVDILGAKLFEGAIHHVEVLNKNTARFVFEVPGYSVEEDTEIREIAVYLSNQILLGRAVFATPIILIKGETTRFNCLLVTSRCDLSTINVTVGDYSSVPTTPFLYQLQSPDESSFNLITVLNGQQNSDGSDSPILAMRYSGGGFQWAFTDHTRVFFGTPTTATGSQLEVNGLALEDNELVIVHVVSGSGVGKTRRYRFTNDKLNEVDSQPINGISSQSTIAVWRRNSGGGAVGGACPYPPDVNGVPPDWVLTRGLGTCPVWAPPKSGGSTSNTLFSPPSKLLMNAISFSGSGDTARYSLGDLILENINYVQPALGGVQQHRSAFDLAGSELEFVEKIDTGIPIELRTFTRTPSNGSRLVVMTDHYVSDGDKKSFRISQPVENANYIKAYIRGTRQMLTTYTYDAATQEVTFVGTIPSGIDLELRSFRNVDLEGYSTQIISTSMTTSDDTFFLELPMIPQSIEYVEVSQSGSHIHNNLLALVDNKIVLKGPIRKNIDVEITIYDSRKSQGSAATNLGGVVVDAVLAGRSLKLLRHNAKPITLPIPGVNLEPGPGIRITGEHPFYRIESTHSEALTDANANFKFSDNRVQKDASEIQFTHRVNLTSDMMITVHSDFQATLGPGFQTIEGLEVMEYVVGFSTSKSKAPDYGRQIAGTSVAGFSSLAGDKNERAYSNASMTQVYDVLVANHPSGYIDIVVKARVQNANIGQYGSLMSLNVNIIGTAKLNQR